MMHSNSRDLIGVTAAGCLVALVLLFPLGAMAQDALTEAPPEPPPPSTAELLVRANVTYEARPDEPSLVYRASVTINGKRLGQTPYTASLRPGRYTIDVEEDGFRASAQVDAVAGQKINVIARFKIPMTEVEKKAKRDAEVAAQIAAQAAADAEWNELHGEWEKKDAKARAKRKPFVISGSLLLVAGTGLAIGGIAAEVAAYDEHDKYLARKELWSIETDPEIRALLKEKMDDAAAARDKNNAMGIAFLCVGGAALVTGVVVLAVMPKRPKEPERETVELHPEIAVVPFLGPDAASLSLHMRF